MAAGLFGALGAIGDTGNQWADSRQIRNDEIVRRLAEKQAQQTGELNMQATRQRMASEQSRDEIAQQNAKQPIALGQPYVGKGGKMYQRYQDPITAAITNKELPGDAPETKIENTYRGLMGMPGMTPEEAGPLAVKLATGRESTYAVPVPGADSPTGSWLEMHDRITGEVLWRTPGQPPRTGVGTETIRKGYDQYGNQTTTVTDRKPIAPPHAGAPGAPGGGYAAGGTAGPPAMSWRPAPPAAPQGMPAAGGGAAFLQALAAANPAAAPAAAAPHAIVRRLAARGPALVQKLATAQVPNAPAAAAAAAGQTSLSSVGTYKNLTPDGQIPPNAGDNAQVAQLANDILAGKDTKDIPTRARAKAEALARQYGWKGQGSLTPKEQLQIQEASTALEQMMEPRLMRALDGASGFWLSSVTTDAPANAIGGEAYRANKKMLTATQQEYIDKLNYLSSLMGGMRKMTGGNASEAQMTRYINELPDPRSTPNSADAARKLKLLWTELQVAKQYGYFPRGHVDPNSMKTMWDAPAPPAADPGAKREAAPAADNPLGLKLPTAGR